MMRRKPTAKTKERRMTAVRGDVMSENFKPCRRENELFSPADIVGRRQREATLSTDGTAATADPNPSL